MSLPANPVIVSAPPRPLRTLFPLLPVMTLATPLPVPLILPAPSKKMFSTLFPRVQLTAVCTVSVPLPTVSTTMSESESTT
ncbi:MAG: hypothetical protein FP819_25515 [Rhizobiaceae bacterium]|nr:hypothetical protein [Rhizobiaceae bacterium]